MAHLNYYMNAYSYSGSITNPANACNESYATYASYAGGAPTSMTFSANNCPGTNYGTITGVTLQPYLYSNMAAPYDHNVTPIFNGSNGDRHYIYTPYGPWWYGFDITSDTNAPATWSWANVTTIDVSYQIHVGASDNRISTVRLIVYYTPVASTLAWSSPAAASTHYRVGTGIAIAGTAANINGVAKVQYNVNGGSWVDCTGTTSWSAIVPQSSLSYGAFTINTRVQDSSTDSVWTTTTARAFAQSSLPSQII